jgi:hypothetical protein
VKLPLIGLIVGAVAAGIAIMKRKKQDPDEQQPQDTNATT